MNKKTTYFAIILAFAAIIIISFYSCDSSPTDYQGSKIDEESKALSKISNLRSVIPKFAKAFAEYLNDFEAQKFLENKIKNSDYVENIIEATELFQSQTELIQGNRKMKGSFKNLLLNYGIKKDKEEISAWINSLQFGEIDIYFPVKNHRENWSAGKDLLVAGFVPDKHNEHIPVAAYNIKGKKYLLPQNKAPDIPTLVIYPSEKNKSYKTKSAGVNNIRYADTERPVDEPPPTGDNWYNCTWTGILVKHDYEGWLGGAMEIYLKIKYRYSENDPWLGWTNFNVQKQITGVDAGHWRRGQAIEVLRVPQNFEAYYEVWERDTPNLDPDDFVADQYYNVIKECGETGTIYASNLIRCDFNPCVDFFLQDGVYPGSDYDMVELHFNRRYAE